MLEKKLFLNLRISFTPFLAFFNFFRSKLPPFLIRLLIKLRFKSFFKKFYTEIYHGVRLKS